MNNKLRFPELAQFIAFGYYIKIEETTWLEYPNPNYMRWVDSYDHTEYHTIPVIREEVKEIRPKKKSKKEEKPAGWDTYIPRRCARRRKD